MSKQRRLALTLVQLADSLVADFDVVDTMTMVADCCVEVLGLAAAGLMLVSPTGELRVVASSNGAVRVLGLLEVHFHEGPSLDCYRTGRPVTKQTLGEAAGRWPRLGPAALAAGFSSVQAVPLRLRSTIIGALNLFDFQSSPMQSGDVDLAQALADMATIAILQHRAAVDARVLNEQLDGALKTRVIIEQAKGILAERNDLDMETAFLTLRRHARNHNLRLVDVAHHIVERTHPISPLDVLPPPRPKRT